jgi:hypothetical protein
MPVGFHGMAFALSVCNLLVLLTSPSEEPMLKAQRVLMWLQNSSGSGILGHLDHGY